MTKGTGIWAWKALSASSLRRLLVAAGLLAAGLGITGAGLMESAVDLPLALRIAFLVVGGLCYTATSLAFAQLTAREDKDSAPGKSFYRHLAWWASIAGAAGLIWIPFLALTCGITMNGKPVACLG